MGGEEGGVGCRIVMLMFRSCVSWGFFFVKWVLDTFRLGGEGGGARDRGSFRQGGRLPSRTYRKVGYVRIK